MPIIINLSLTLILCIFFIFGVFYFMTRCKRIMLGVCFVFVAAGFSIYTAGYLSSGKGFTYILFALLRGIFSTASMFSLNDNYEKLANVQGIQWLTENIYLQIFFWFCHISALALIQAALISFFGRKLIDNFRLRFGSHNEVYIIKGSDKNAFILAENIVTHDAEYKHPDKNRLIVFILEEDDDEEKINEKASRFGGIVQVPDRNHDILYYLKKTRLGKTKKKKYTIILMQRNESAPDDAYHIAEFVKRKNVNSEKLDIFVFIQSEWDREQVEKITQAKDGNQRKYPYTFHIVSEVDLMIRQMIEKRPPFECPGLNFSGGAAARNFTVMILGFGTVGQSALLRLMMNGQFVGSRMRAIIIDRNIDNLRDCFLHRYPGLGLCCDIEFKNFDVQNKEFFTLLNEIQNMDYIVIALCGNKINKQTALNIKLNYERKNNALPFIAVSEENGSSREVKQDENIFTFGCREEIYKESIIISEKTDRMAKTINKMYGRQRWHELDWFLQESNRAAADFIPAMLKLAKLDEKEAVKKNTLTDDNSLAEILAQTEHLRWNAFHAAMGYCPISIEEMNRRFKEYNGNGNSLDFARRDSKARLQVCLVSWDELDKISEAYRELECSAGLKPERDFKLSDRDIIKNIPLFLKERSKKSL